MVRVRKETELNGDEYYSVNYFNGHSWKHIAKVRESQDGKTIYIESDLISETEIPAPLDYAVEAVVEMALGEVNISEVQWIF